MESKKSNEMFSPLQNRGPSAGTGLGFSGDRDLDPSVLGLNAVADRDSRHPDESRSHKVLEDAVHLRYTIAGFITNSVQVCVFKDDSRSKLMRTGG
jgi:hypothetical protein